MSLPGGGSHFLLRCHGFPPLIGISKPCSMSWGMETLTITSGHNSKGGSASTLWANVIASRSSCKYSRRPQCKASHLIHIPGAHTFHSLFSDISNGLLELAALERLINRDSIRQACPPCIGK